MLLPPAMRDQDRQQSNPFGARKPRPDELRGPQPPAAPVLKRTALPEPTPQHISDHEMIVRDLPMDGKGVSSAVLRRHQQSTIEMIDAIVAGLAGFSSHRHTDFHTTLSGDGWCVRVTTR